MPSLTRHEAVFLVDGSRLASDGLLEALLGVVDPRARRGVRHGFATILGIAVCAVLAGARSYQAIAEWASDLTSGVRRRLGVARGRAPSESTIRRALQGVDDGDLGQIVSAWLATRVRAAAAPGQPVVIAVDGRAPAVPAPTASVGCT